MVGNFCTSRKFGLRRSLSRISTRVSTEAASIVASRESFDGSLGSYVADPFTLVNAPRTVDTARWRTENCAAVWLGSICQVPACAAAVAAKSREAMRLSKKRSMVNTPSKDRWNLTTLNGFDRNRQQVLDESHFLLQKRLAVGHARQHAIEPRHGVDACADLIMGRE